MSHTALVAALNLEPPKVQLVVAFWVCCLLSIAGLVLMVLWAKRVFKKVATHGYESALLYMMPGLLAYVILSIPMVYFNGQLKQETYCIGVIKANPGITPNDEFLAERCERFNIQGLFERAK